MSTTRLYLVLACIGGATQAPRLIEAGTQAAARNHATKDWITVKPASPKEVAKLIASGVRLEVANEAPAEQQGLILAPPPPDGGTPAPGGGYTFDEGTTGGQGLGSAPELPDADLSAGTSDDSDVVDAEVPRDEPVAESSMSRRRRRVAA